MDEKYIQDLYNVVVKNDPSFKVDVSYDSFRQKMSDQNYAKKIYGWVSGVDQEFKNNNPEDQFMNLVTGGLAGTPIEREIKKKGNTGSSSVLGSSGFKRFDPATGKIQSQTPEFESVDVVESEQQPEAQQPAKELSTGEYLLNSMNAVSRGFYKNLIGNPAKGLGTLLEQGTATIFGGSGKGPISDALIGFGTWFNNAIDEVAPQDDEFRGSLVDQGGQAIGQVLSTVLTAGVGGMASKTLGAAAPALQTAKTTGAVASTVKEVASGVASLPGISSALSVGQSEFERAKDGGATDEQAFEAFYKNAAAGSVLERLPIMQFFKRFNKASQGSVIDYIKTKGVAGLTGGIEEMTTEIVQQLYANKTAQEIYNINQELFEGVGESGGIGFGIGFLLNALGANARILRQNGKTAEANVIEQQLSELENRAEKGGKSSYKVNGFPVNDPKIINDMIDKLNGADLSSSNIEISNDPELNAKLQNKIVDDAIKNQIRQASPDLNNASVNAIADLQKELNKLEGNTTQVAKDRAAEIRSRIKEIQANPITEEPSVYKVGGKDVTPDVIDELIKTKSKEELLAMKIEVNNDQTGLAERLQAAVGTKPESQEIDPFSPEEQRRRLIDWNNRRISKIEELLSQPDNGNGTVTVDDKIIERTELEKELETLKTEIDAVQKQAAGQVSVQSGTGVGQEVAEGEPQAEPQVATQEGQTQEDLQEKINEIEEKRKTALRNVVQIIGDEGVEFGSVAFDENGTNILRDIWGITGKTKEEAEANINAKYDADIAALQPQVEVKAPEITVQAETQTTTTQDPIQLAKENLGKRLSGDQLLDSQDLIDELNDNKAEIDEDGMVTVYHRTTPDKKAEIERTGEMKGLEDGVFFSTKEAGQNQGYGDAVVKLKVPVEQLTLDDTFGDEAHLRIATAKAGDTVNVKEFIQAEPPLQEIGQELNETDLPGYNKMMNAIDGIIDRASRRKGSTPESVMEGVIKYLGSRSQAYINATDVQREKIIRDVRKRFKKREKSAPSADKITGKPKKQVTVDEMAALKDQIKLESKAAREAKADLNTKRRIIADAINKLATEGKVAAKKAEAMVKKLARLNVDSSTAVNKFIDYVSNVFQDAEYSSRLSSAKSLRSKINKISKNKDKLANLRDLGSKFTSIDPSMLTSEELAEYNEIADKVLKSIQGSTLKGRGKLVDMVVEADVSKYVDDVVKKQNEQRLKDSIDELSEMLGVELTEAEYIQLMEGKNPEEVLDKKYDEAKMRASIQKAFDLYSTMIQESLRTGKDLFTGQEVNYSDNQKKTITAFMDMDLNYLNSKVALEAVDALMNFVNNGSTAKMDAILNKYNGEKNMIDALNDGVVSRVVRKLWSKGLGKVLIEQGANINIVFERVFGGFNRGQKMEEAMGVADLVNGKAEAQKEADNIIDEYVNKFFTRKPNNQLFNTAFNNIERGMGAWMSRNVFGTDAEMRAEFKRRKDLILKVNADGTRTGTIAELEKGNEQEVEKAKIYQEVYDKILKDAESIEDVQSKMDKTNLEAVNFWQNKWRDKYQELSDVALGVYNKVLEKDVDYIPDRFSKLSSDTGKPKDLLNDEMAFIVNSGTANIYKKETGVLMSATKPKKLPTDPDTGNTNRYVDLSFDSNNANAMYDALVDINTAGAIRQIDAAMNSDAFKKIMQDKRDAAIIQNRIRLYVANIRKKNPYSNDELTKAVKKLNRLAAIGVGQSLGGVTQPVKQTIPIVINTFINAGSLDFKSLFDRSKQDFINRSGRSIANRGLESQAQISTLNKMIDEVANSKGEKLFKAIEKVNDWQLKNLLVKWDVGVARMSWMTYYQQALKKQGINPSSIDWSTHEVNEKAANYAQRQVDRQQNVSDADMAAELLSSKDSKTQLIMKGLMPFASFRMNQSARLGSDLSVLMNWKTSDSADRKIAARSVAGFAAEMATFRILSAGIAILLYDATKAIIGGDEDKEKRDKKIDAIIKGQLTSTVADTFSPLPLLDPLVQGGAASFLESAQDLADIEEEDRVSIYGSNKRDAVQSFGTFGIALDRALQLWEMGELIMGVGFKDDFGRTKYASQRHREALELLFVPAIMSNIGLAPSEVNSIVRNTVSDSKRNASTVKGGKTKQQEQVEKFEKFEKEVNKEKDAIATAEEIKVLEELISSESDSDVIDAANERIKELRNPDDEGFSERRKIKKAKKEELLGEYDNMTDMERYDPALFEERFGEYSEYYQENRGEAELDKKLNKLNRKAKDEERGYYQRKKK